MINFTIHDLQRTLAGTFLLFLSVSTAAAARGREAKHEECPATRQTSEQRESVSELVRRNQDIVVATVMEQRPLPKGEWRGANREFRVVIDIVVKGNEFPEHRVFEIAGLESDSLYPIDPYVLGAHSKHESVEVEYPGFSQNNAEYPPFGGTRQFELASAKGLQECGYAPMLEVGMTYLMFLSQPYTSLSFEPIVNVADDAWLRRVSVVVEKQRLGSQK
jgi:hypothetical protein